MVERKRGIRRALAGLGVMLLLTLTPALPAGAQTGAAPGPAEGPDLLLADRGQPPALLVPGSTSRWVLGVTTKGVQPSELSLRLSAAGPLAEAAASGPEQLLTVQVSACPGEWAAGSCSEGSRTVIPPTPVAALDATIRSLASPGGVIPAGVELLVAVTLSPAAGNAVQGLSATLTARVDAAGEPLPQTPDGDGTPDGGLPGGALPDTGLRLGGLALLGAAAVAAGMMAAGWARRSMRNEATQGEAAPRKARA